MTDLSRIQARAARVNAIYRQTFNVPDDPAFYIGKIAEEAGEVVGAHLRAQGLSRGAGGDDVHEKLADELADLFGFLLVYCDREGIDLAAAFERKWGRYLER